MPTCETQALPRALERPVCGLRTSRGQGSSGVTHHWRLRRLQKSERAEDNLGVTPGPPDMRGSWFLLCSLRSVWGMVKKSLGSRGPGAGRSNDRGNRLHLTSLPAPGFLASTHTARWSTRAGICTHNPSAPQTLQPLSWEPGPPWPGGTDGQARGTLDTRQARLAEVGGSGVRWGKHWHRRPRPAST